ncbi:hypothetical protein [Paenirhodobacter sp.]|uniref:hypothetical protein n=1 Tax=Paenirhodobacter sp. TaxID=1965326 RepID=UPI003B414F13
MIGLDFGPSVFVAFGVSLIQVHGAAADGAVSRVQRLTFFAAVLPCVVAMETFASVHYCGRAIGNPGHEVRLIPLTYVKPHRNDMADAGAIAESVLRPTMRGREERGQAGGSGGLPHPEPAIAHRRPTPCARIWRSGASLPPPGRASRSDLQRG